MIEKIPITVYHLQMTTEDQFRPSTRAVSDFEIRQAIVPSPDYSRFLYATVGAKWRWYERLSWTRERWLAWLDRPEQETWVGYAQGTPAGYFELEHQPNATVQIIYFGLMPDFIGNGYGGVLLSAAIRRGWKSGAKRVWVHTCTMDHEYALRNYLARGFQVFKEENKDVVIPPAPAVSPL
jgi:GNAT superfamily N-acetyltransferase